MLTIYNGLWELIAELSWKEISLIENNLLSLFTLLLIDVQILKFVLL